jgi:excisionase family DNA binding protein
MKAAISPPPLDDQYFPLTELSTYAGLSVRTLRGYLQDPVGPLPHYRVGGRILVRRSDYDAWVRRFRSNVAAVADQILNEVLHAVR